MRARHSLVGLLVAVAALAMNDCDGDGFTCGLNSDEPLAALMYGLLCSGLNPPDDGKSPTASFTIAPNPVRSGETVSFDASASSDPDGDIIKYEWDLDGDTGGADAFEVFNGEDPVLERPVFLSPPAHGRTIWLRVTDSAGRTEESAVLEITPGVVLAAEFTISPSPAIVGLPVQFDASGSTGAVQYSWKFEREGGFSEPSASRTASHVFTSPGERSVLLMVRDVFGDAVETSRVLNVRSMAAGAAAVSHASARASGRVTALARGRRFTARLTGVSFPFDPKAIAGRGSVGSLRGVPSTGRLLAGGRQLGALRRFRRARFVARLNLAANLRTRTATMRGLALATFAGGRGRACLRIAVSARAGRRPSGTLTILGGSGTATRLAARARFGVRRTDGAVRLRGRVRTRTRPPRPLPATCARGHARRACAGCARRGRSPSCGS